MSHFVFLIISYPQTRYLGLIRHRFVGRVRSTHFRARRGRRSGAADSVTKTADKEDPDFVKSETSLSAVVRSDVLPTYFIPFSEALW